MSHESQTPDQVAQWLEVSTATVLREVKRGRLRSCRPGLRVYRFKREDGEEYQHLRLLATAEPLDRPGTEVRPLDKVMSRL